MITPGTPFMAMVADACRWYIRDRQQKSPYWRSLLCLLSDSNTPGEGEHKMASLIRAMRHHPAYPPGMRHAVHGLDADLVFLSLATHERDMIIVRDHVDMSKPGAPTGRPEGAPAGMSNYDFLKIGVVREYLQKDFRSALAAGADFERVVVDYVLLCFMVGNDFLPHMPFLALRNGALDLLAAWSCDVVTSTTRRRPSRPRRKHPTCLCILEHSHRRTARQLHRRARCNYLQPAPLPRRLRLGVQAAGGLCGISCGAMVASTFTI